MLLVESGSAHLEDPLVIFQSMISVGLQNQSSQSQRKQVKICAGVAINRFRAEIFGFLNLLGCLILYPLYSPVRSMTICLCRKTVINFLVDQSISEWKGNIGLIGKFDNRRLGVITSLREHICSVSICRSANGPRYKVYLVIRNFRSSKSRLNESDKSL